MEREFVAPTEHSIVSRYVQMSTPEKQMLSTSYVQDRRVFCDQTVQKMIYVFRCTCKQLYEGRTTISLLNKHLSLGCGKFSVSKQVSQ